MTVIDVFGYAFSLAPALIALNYLGPKFHRSPDLSPAFRGVATISYPLGGLAILGTLIHCVIQTRWWAPIAILPAAMIISMILGVVVYKIERIAHAVTVAFTWLSVLVFPLQIGLINFMLANGGFSATD